MKARRTDTRADHQRHATSAQHLHPSYDYTKELCRCVSRAARSDPGGACLARREVGQELVDYVKANLGSRLATSGVGSNQHVLTEWFKREAGINMNHVPYRGAGQAINDLVAAHVKVAFLGPTSLMPHAAAGTLHMLAQSTAKRSPTLQQVPTLEEAGYKGLVLEAWYAAFVPKGTPPAIIAKLNAEMNKALKDPKLTETFTKGAIEPVGGGTEEIGKLALADSVKYARLVKELNIKTN
jgi:tripartite-type tricarboxylate transporter receptor subunit TctC